MNKKIKKETKIVLSLLFGLIIWFLMSGISYMNGYTEEKISYFLKNNIKSIISSDASSDINSSFSSIKCTGIFNIDCVINDLKVSDELGGVLYAKNVILYGINNLYSTEQKNNNFIKMKLDFKSVIFYDNRIQYSILENIYYRIFHSSDIDIDIDYKVKNNITQDIKINKIFIDNSYFSINIDSFFENLLVLNNLNIELYFKKPFMNLMYDKFYLGLPSQSYKIFNETLGFKQSTPLSFDKYNETSSILINDLNSFVEREDILQIKSLTLLTNNIKAIILNNSNMLTINIDNSDNISIKEIFNKFNDYLFNGKISFEDNKIFGLTLESSLENRED